MSKRIKNVPVSRSLAYLKFIRRHEGELRSHWFQQTAATYAALWIRDNLSELPARIASQPKEIAPPFSEVTVPAAYFLDAVSSQRQRSAHTAILRLVTVFENFLYDCIQRAVFVDASVLGASEIKIEGKIIADAIGAQSVRAWFAHHVADKYVRGKSPQELIERVDRMLQAGISKRLAGEIGEYVQWTIVRNAIAHLGGDVTQELAEKWNSRFPKVGARIELVDADVLRVAHLTRVIAAQLDQGQVPMSARDADRDLLAYEMFVRLGIDDPSVLSARVTSILSVGLTHQDAERLIAQFQKMPTEDAGIVFTEDMLAEAAARNGRKKII